MVTSAAWYCSPVHIHKVHFKFSASYMSQHNISFGKRKRPLEQNYTSTNNYGIKVLESSESFQESFLPNSSDSDKKKSNTFRVTKKMARHVSSRTPCLIICFQIMDFHLTTSLNAMIHAGQFSKFRNRTWTMQ